MPRISSYFIFQIGGVGPVGLDTYVFSVPLMKELKAVCVGF